MSPIRIKQAPVEVHILRQTYRDEVAHITLHKLIKWDVITRFLVQPISLSVECRRDTYGRFRKN